MSTHDILPQWDLSDLFPSLESVEYKTCLENLSKNAGAFQKYRSIFENNASVDPKEMLFALESYEKIEIDMLHAFAFCQLQYDVDTTDQTVKKAHAKIQQLVAEISTQLEFFSQGIKQMSEDVVSVMLASPELSPYAHLFTTLRLYTPYTLPEKEERLLTLKSVHASDAWGQLHTEMSSTLDFGSMVIGGVETKLTPALLKSLVSSSPDASVRKDAYEKVRKPFGNFSNIFSFMFNTVVTDFEQEARDIRGFTSGLEEAALGEEVTEVDIQNMMEVTREYIPLFQTYYTWKKKMLKKEVLESSDLMAPLTEKRKEIPFAKGKELVLGAFREFDPVFAETAASFFEKNWIDARQGKNKYAGAYCYSMEKHPYILLNYQPDYQQVFTMAHELGHGIHYMFSREEQPFLMRNTSKVIAESASQFSELLLLEYLTKVEEDAEARVDLLSTHIDDLMYCLFSAITVTAFEQGSHEMVRKEGLSAQGLQDLWEKVHGEVYGDVVKRTEEDPHGWARIPHMFQSPFYYFTYPMSLLVVLACFSEYKKQGAAFAPIFRRFLAQGGSVSPRELIREALGVEFGSKEFFRHGFSVLEGFVQKALLEK